MDVLCVAAHRFERCTPPLSPVSSPSRTRTLSLKTDDPHIISVKEWAKQGEFWQGWLRDWPDPNHGQWKTGQRATWKTPNSKR